MQQTVAGWKSRASSPIPSPGAWRWRTSPTEVEGLTLLKAENSTGYFGVNISKPGYPKPYQARVRRGGKQVSLGMFATAPEEAALCVARSPEGQEAVKRAAAPAPLTSEEARQQAHAEGLRLLVADNKAGYFGVSLNNPGKPKPYQAHVWRGGKDVSLGNFATAEEAALCVARSPEGQAAAKKAAAAAPLTSEEARQQARAAAKRPAAAASLTSKKVGRKGARSLRRKELPDRREHVLTAVGARSAEEAEVGARRRRRRWSWSRRWVQRRWRRRMWLYWMRRWWRWWRRWRRRAVVEMVDVVIARDCSRRSYSRSSQLFASRHFIQGCVARNRLAPRQIGRGRIEIR